MSELLKKVADLEDKVQTDVKDVKFKPNKKNKKGDSDTESQTSKMSKASVPNAIKPNLNLQRRFTKKLGTLNPGQMV